jgi:hypothetical protein
MTDENHQSEQSGHDEKSSHPDDDSPVKAKTPLTEQLNTTALIQKNILYFAAIVGVIIGGVEIRISASRRHRFRC